ncbi:PAAR domain-containing protein, partial [Photorhabdus sp. RW14-46]|uniref:PAAR domain-containing protein n=1 Tax=Photorhabdus sp. RW14-46 TaxID=2100168 RepID=UPI001A98660E
MSVLMMAWLGAGTAQRTTRTGTTPADNTPPPTEGSSSADTVLNYLESERFQYHSLTAAMTYTVAVGGAPAILPLVAGVAAGKLGAQIGNNIGESLTHGVMGVLGPYMGQSTVATEGQAPARLGDAIAHQNKSAGLWGALGGVLLGALAAVAVGGLIVATGGLAMAVVAGAAAGLAGGFVGGLVSSVGATLGQYGANKGQIVEGSPNVFFEGQPVARQGDKIMCSDHPGSVVIAEGAKTVFANGKPIARLGHRTTCDANINSAAASIAITPQTGDALTILTANNKDLRWLVAIAGLLPLPLGRKGNGGKVKSGAEPTPSVKKTGCDSQLCSKAGEPVDVATGDFLQVWPVLALPGVLPLTLNRTYRSTAALAGLFGPKWADDWSQHLRRDGEETHFTDGEGVIYTFHTPAETVFSVNLHAGHYLLYGQRDGELRLFNRRTQQILSFAEVQGDKRRLSMTEDRNGN